MSHAQQRSDPTDGGPRIVALDPRWTVSFETAPAAAAGFDQDMAYVPLKGGQLVGIDLNAGQIRWTVELATATTPATGDGLVFASAAAQVTALEQRTGRTLWQTPLDAPLSSALYWDSGVVLASTEGGTLTALSAADGRVLWNTALGSPVVVRPTPFGERLFVGLEDGRIAALTLESGVSEWTYALKQPITGMLALDEQLLVGTRANLLHSFSLNRARLRWSQKAGADIAGAPAADDDHIYFVAFDNLLRALDRGNGSVKWTRKLPSRPSGGPLRADNVVFVPFTTTDIGAYLAATGVEAFTIRSVGELGAIPFLRENVSPTEPRLVTLSREGALQGFAQRIEPPPAALAELPGVKVGG